MFDQREFDRHEEVRLFTDRKSGLRAIIAIHSTALGPAFGGCRMWPYPDDAAALADALRLARGMTYKAAICELPYGGGKTVVIGDPARDKTPALLHALGRAVERLGGRYIIADDVGTTLDDLKVIGDVTRHTAARTPAAREPLGVTGYGVFMAMRAAVEHRLGRADLAGLRVAVQGLGNVGFPLCRWLHEAGASLVVADMEPVRAAKAAVAFGARAVAPALIHRQPAEVFAPCAIGGILNDQSIPELAAQIVCGGANNQLAEPRHADTLAARGMLYVPDYVANAGGVIDCHQEKIDDSPEAVLEAVGRIHAITRDILERATTSGQTPLAVADAMVEARLAAASLSRAA